MSWINAFLTQSKSLFIHPCKTTNMNLKRISSCILGMLFLAVPSQAQKPNVLAWTEWNQTTPASIKPTLSFTDSSINAFAGCNQIFGSYTLTGSKLTFSSLGSTRKACEAGKMKLEQDFMASLTKVRSFTLSKDGKILNLSAKGTRLSFKLARETPSGFVTSGRKTLNVSPEMTACFDNAQKQCLLLEDLSDGTGWGKFTENQIEGLNFEVGYSYQIQVVIETNTRTKQRRLRLLEIIMQHWSKSVTPTANQKIFEIAPNLADCVAMIKTQCMQVREPDGNWGNFFGSIEGFTFKPDFSYKLLVTVSKIENPPADSPNLKYTLVRLLDLDPVRR
jgi:heat shock protein HslJ